MIYTPLLGCVLAVTLTSTLLASGSRPSSPQRGPRSGESQATREKLDNTKYALGKAVFTGKAALIKNPSATVPQRARLQIAAARAGKDGASLPRLAGKLSEPQLDALEYYIAKRFSR